MSTIHIDYARARHTLEQRLIEVRNRVASDLGIAATLLPVASLGVALERVVDSVQDNPAAVLLSIDPPLEFEHDKDSGGPQEPDVAAIRFTLSARRMVTGEEQQPYRAEIVLGAVRRLLVRDTMDKAGQTIEISRAGMTSIDAEENGAAVVAMTTMTGRIERRTGEVFPASIGEAVKYTTQ